MATYATIPDNKSFLSNNKFEFVLDRIPNFTFFVQTITIPSVTLVSTVVPSPTTSLSIPGNQLSFNEVSIGFIIDENMESWYEIYNWMYQLGNPESFDKRGELTGEPGSYTHIYSDASLLIKTNSNNPNKKITFYDMYPIDLSEVQFTTIDTGQDFISASVTFSYNYFEFNNSV